MSSSHASPDIAPLALLHSLIRLTSFFFFIPRQAPRVPQADRQTDIQTDRHRPRGARAEREGGSNRTKKNEQKKNGRQSRDAGKTVDD